MVDAADSKSASEKSESSSLSRRTKCSCGETGIRSRLKICQPQGFVSSTLTESTVIDNHKPTGNRLSNDMESSEV